MDCSEKLRQFLIFLLCCCCVLLQATKAAVSSCGMLVQEDCTVIGFALVSFKSVREDVFNGIGYVKLTFKVDYLQERLHT